MAFIHSAPGVSGEECTVKLANQADSSDTYLLVPALQDVTINNANDVFTWSQLDATAKQQVATTSTNSISMNIVLDPTTWFGSGSYSATGTMANNGILQSSINKDKVEFIIDLGGATAKSIEGEGYITGLAPTSSADSPVWISPITVTVTGEYTLGTNVTA